MAASLTNTISGESNNRMHVLGEFQW